MEGRQHESPLLSLPAGYCFPRLSQEHGAVIQFTPLEHCAAELCLPGCNSPDSRKTSTPGGGSCTPRLPRQELCLQRERGVSKRWVNAPSASLTPLCSLSYLAEGGQGVEKLLGKMPAREVPCGLMSFAESL